MDILLISRCPPFPLHQGDRLIPYHLARQLASRRHKIDLVAYYSQRRDLADIPRYEKYFRDIVLIREPQRTVLDYYQRLRNPARMFPKRAEESWSPDMWNAITARLTTNRYGLVKLFGGIQVSEFRELIRTLPNLIVPYESYSLFLARSLANETNPIKRLMVRMQLNTARQYEAKMFNGYDGVVMLSDMDAHALRTMAPHLPLHVIPNGVDTDYFVPTGQEADNPNLLFIGNFAYPPNLDAALHLVQDIMPLVWQQVPIARVLLVGSNPPPALTALGSKNIEVSGHVPDLRPFMERAQVFVSPLRMGAGIKNKVLEAMAMQKAIVATPISCDGISLVEETNMLLANTPQRFATAITRLIKQPELRRNMGLANRQLIESRFTWQRVAEQYEALYRQIIDLRDQQMQTQPISGRR